MAASTWTSPEIDARIVALKQTGMSHAQIAREIGVEFRVFVNKNMVLRRSRTILGIDRGEKAANDRLERKRAAERAAPKPAPRPVNVPAPTVTLPPLASVVVDKNTHFSGLVAPGGLGPIPPTPAPLGNGKCQFPKWGNEPPTHEYCGKRTPLGSSWCAECRAVVWHTYRQARAA